MKEADFQKELNTYEKMKEGQRTDAIANVEKKKVVKEKKVTDTKSTNLMVLDKEEKSDDDLNKNSSSKNKIESSDKLAPSEDTTTSDNILSKMDWAINDKDSDVDKDQNIFGGSFEK